MMKKYTKHEEKLRRWWHRRDCCLDEITYDDIITMIDCNVPKHEQTDERIKKEFEILLKSHIRDAKDMFSLVLDKIKAEL